jgi:hypothetical protein
MRHADDTTLVAILSNLALKEGRETDTSSLRTVREYMAWESLLDHRKSHGTTL